MNTTLTHGSNNASLNLAGTITKGGKWGSFLFFTEDDSAPYAFKCEYKIEIDEDTIATGADIRWNVNYGDDEYADAGRAVVALYAKAWGVDEDTALGVITEDLGMNEIWDAEGIEDNYIAVQHAAGVVAVALGFAGACLQDDTGRVVILDMLGRETELVKQ